MRYGFDRVANIMYTKDYKSWVVFDNEIEGKK